MRSIGFFLCLSLMLTVTAFAGSGQQSPDANRQNCPPNMTAYWKLDETSGTTYFDYFDGHDGEALVSPPTPSTDGVVNGSQDFNGTSDFFTVADADNFDWAHDASFTIELWAKLTNVSSRNKVMIGRDEAGGHPHWWVGAQQDDGYVVWNMLDVNGNGVACNGTTAINDGVEWHHIVAVRDESLNENRLYVDGGLEATQGYDYSADFSASTTLGIGYMAYNGNPDYYYDGLLDEIALYSRALSVAEIQAHYTNGLAGIDYCNLSDTPPTITSSPETSATVGQLYTYDVEASGVPAPTYELLLGPAGMTIDEFSGLIQWTPTAAGDVFVTVGANNIAGSDTQDFIIYVAEPPPCPELMSHYWKLDETTGPPYEDFWGTADATCSSCPTLTTGLVGNAQWFNTNEVNVPDDDSLDWSADASFSLAFWMKTDQSTSGNRVLLGRDDAGSDLHWWIGADGNAKARFQLRDSSGGGIYIGGSGPTLNNNEWHFVVAVRDGSTDMNYLYVDGGVVGEGTHDYTTGFASSVPMNIGFLNLGGGYHYHGAMDEIATFDRALPETEILELHAQGLSGYGYCDEVAVAPTIVSTPPTEGLVGQLYSYDVNATGVPTPTYALTTSPAGMTIDPASGLIEWTPTAAGLVDVEVAASSSAGTDTQFWQINVTEPPPCPPDILAYWQLDETSGTTYLDFWDGHDGDAPASPPTPATDAVVGGSQDFNGSSDFIDVPDHSDFDWAYDASFTIELWAKFTNIGGNNKVMVGRDEAGGTPHWWVGAQSGSGVVNFNLLDMASNGIACLGTTAINDDTWHHIVALRDESLNENRIYVDGILEDTQSWDYTAGFAAGTPLNIGYMAYNFSPGYFYDGLLDEVAVYGRALADTEIAEHYALGMAGYGYCDDAAVAPTITSVPVTEAYVGLPYSYDVEATGLPAPTYSLTVAPGGMTIDETTGLIEWTPAATGDVDVTVVATNSAGSDEQSFTLAVLLPPPCPLEMISYWRLDETAGSPYVDIHGGYDASGINNPTPAAGRLGGAQWFDGANDELDVADAGQYDWNSGNSFTIELWMNTSASTAGNRVIVGRDDASNPLHWWVGASDDGRAHFGLRDTANDYQGITGTSTINDGAWHHIVAVRDATLNQNRLYVDTVEENLLDHHYTGGFSGTAPLNIGYLNLSGHYRYEGAADELAIYGRVLSEVEILDHFNGGAGREYCDLIAPVIVTTPLTSGLEGLPYSYDADATGIPTPTYTLLVAPTGMTIDPGTGQISWTPEAGGLYDVELEASNTGGSALQSFQISVEAAPECPEAISHYWPLDETDGAPYEDFWGNADATCGACPDATTGIVNGAQWFDSSNEVNAPVGSSCDWAADASFSLVFWMKTGESTSGNRVILGRDDSGSDLHWWLGPNSDGFAFFQLRDVSGNGIAIGGSGPLLNNDVWHLVVAVRDAATDANVLYVDGEIVAMDSYDYQNDFASGVDINIGYLNLGGHYRYHGALDEVAIYDRALQHSEIGQQYLNGLLNHGYCETFAPFIVTTPTTAIIEGQYYYDVDAAGHPTPTYALSVAPEGMTIDPVTGLINWEPSLPGEYDVTVVAMNSEGSDEQSYVLSVDEATGNVASPIMAATTATGVNLTWDYDEDVVTGFHIYRRTEPGSVTRLTEIPVAGNAGRIAYVDPAYGVSDGTILYYSYGMIVDGEEIGRSNEVAITINGSTPTAFRLHPNYPNPFNPITNIKFDLPKPGHVRLSVYDVTGHLVRTLVDDVLPAAVHLRQWDGKNSGGHPCSSGVYYFKLITAELATTQKMLLIK